MRTIEDFEIFKGKTLDESIEIWNKYFSIPDYNFPIPEEITARAFIQGIEARLPFKNWKKCSVVYMNEKRSDRRADTTLSMEIRLFDGGKDLSTLLHEMAHNSVHCLEDLAKISYGIFGTTEILMYGDHRDGGHLFHHALMEGLLFDIFLEWLGEALGWKKGKKPKVSGRKLKLIIGGKDGRA